MNYDVFISYKQTDANGNLTPDCEIAKKLYNALASVGYNVFFSSNTLEKIGSSRYKADIDNALDTAKVMIVVLTQTEYALSQWVQYEWDSFYNDYLSGVRKQANLFTLTTGVNILDLPRTLRNVQNFDYNQGLDHVCDYVKNVIPVNNCTNQVDTQPKKEKRFEIITGKQITLDHLREGAQLDAITYDDIYHVDFDLGVQWLNINPDIYVMAKDISTDKVIAYVNVSPVTDECYEKIKNGDFIDTGITADMLLNYDMPCPYNIYFSSIVVHPDYHNTEVFMELVNAVIDKFILLGEHEVYVRRMIADAVTSNGEKLCRLFGMQKVKNSNHDSCLYEITMMPPKFKIISKKIKQLYDFYKKKYEECPWLFDSNED